MHGLEEAIAGPLARAAATLDQSVRRSKDKRLLDRLLSEQLSMNFTLGQARLFYHLLKGERLYRIWKSQHDQDAGLNALTELALARHTWESQKSFVATSGMKANPLMPDPSHLEARTAELIQAITNDPATAVGVNIFGFASDQLDEQLMRGVNGYILAGPTGSKAVLWTDVAAYRSSLHGVHGIAWLDELGRPLSRNTPDLYAAPAVADAKGMPADQLFRTLIESQSNR